MYIRNITAGTYGVNLDYLILDSAGKFAVPTVVVYPYSSAANYADAKTAYAARNSDSDVRTQVVSADNHAADITKLKFGTRYILALGNVDPEEGTDGTFTAYDTISFTTEDLQVNFQVTAVNKNSVDVNADVTRNFEVQDQNSFYFAVYNTDDDTVLMQQQISGADLNALRSDGGLKKSLGLATVLDDTSQENL